MTTKEAVENTVRSIKSVGGESLEHEDDLKKLQMIFIPCQVF
jgi:hypothetical protein